MSGFQVFLTPEAQADLERLDPLPRARILDKLAWMGQNAQYLRHQPLQGEEWAGCFKYRVGDCRIIYQLSRSGQRLLVLKVEHRSDVYA